MQRVVVDGEVSCLDIFLGEMEGEVFHQWVPKAPQKIEDFRVCQPRRGFVTFIELRYFLSSAYYKKSLAFVMK